MGRRVHDGAAVDAERSSSGADFAMMYREHVPALRALLVELVPAHAAEEIAHEVFAAVWRLDGFDSRLGTRKAYLRAIARNKAIDWLRRNASAADREDRWARLAGPVESVDDHVCAVDQAAQVRRALVSLGSERRQAIALAYYGGLSYREVATVLDVPEGTVKTRIRQGLLQLRAQLGPATASDTLPLPN